MGAVSWHRVFFFGGSFFLLCFFYSARARGGGFIFPFGCLREFLISSSIFFARKKKLHDSSSQPSRFGSGNSRGMNERERSVAAVVSSALAGSLRLELYPRTEIDVSVLVLDDDGGVLPASIVAGSLALVRLEGGFYRFGSFALMSHWYLY
jgi:hypothetical protein